VAGYIVDGTRSVDLRTLTLEFPVLITLRPHLPLTEAVAGTGRSDPMEISLGLQVGVPVETWMDTQLAGETAQGPISVVDAGRDIEPGYAVKLVAALGLMLHEGRWPVVLEGRYTLDLRDRMRSEDTTNVRVPEDSSPIDSRDFPLEELKEESVSVSLKTHF